jgi:DNA replicative helicase MCM subunit Mcm2 (Cdc46/Mcm family)
LSRFDCIFIVKDIRDESADKLIASHVVNLHTYAKAREDTSSEISIEMMKKYLTYAKMKYFPRLSEEAGHIL